MSTKNDLYLAAVSSTHDVVRVVFKRDLIEEHMEWLASFKASVPMIDYRKVEAENDKDFQSCPVNNAYESGKLQDSPFTTYSYLIPKGEKVQLGDAVLVVGQYGVSLAYVYDVASVDMGYHGKIAQRYGSSKEDGFFWQHIVGRINYSQYNKANEHRANWLEEVDNRLQSKHSSVVTAFAEENDVDAQTVQELMMQFYPQLENKE